MQKVYLDYNIFIFYFENKHTGLREKIDKLKQNYILPFSPAHMEEVASLLMSEKPETKEFYEALQTSIEKIEDIADLTNNFEIFPNLDGPTLEIREDPIECFKRVVSDYDLNAELYAMEKARLRMFKKSDEGGQISRKTSNLNENILSTPVHEHELKFRLYFGPWSLKLALEAKKYGIKEFKWPEIAKSHSLLEIVIEMAMNYLEEIRYKPEKIKKNRPRSRMHDVTHSIYGTSADYFISDDAKLVAKLKATYHYFNIPTKVMTFEQLMNTEDFKDLIKA